LLTALSNKWKMERLAYDMPSHEDNVQHPHRKFSTCTIAQSRS
jgi:hypothetical protein